MSDQSGRRPSGRFAAGHKGFKPKGTQHKATKDLKQRAEIVARKLGGKGGVDSYLKTNPKLLNDLLRDAARDRAVPLDADGNPATVVFENNLEILAVPHGMCSIPASLGGGYCCRELVRFLIAAEKAGTLGPFRQSAADAVDDTCSLSVAVPYKVPRLGDRDGVVAFPGRRRVDDDEPPPAA